MPMSLEASRTGRAPVMANFEPDKPSGTPSLTETCLLDMVASGHPLTAVLDFICRFAEEAVEGVRCAICLIDWSGPRFRDYAAPSLPATFGMSVCSLPLRHDGGPCAKAACLRMPVIVADFDTDPMWQHSTFRALAVAHGLRSCWATPIYAGTGQVLGTLAILRAQPTKPSPRLDELMDRLSKMASLAIERTRAEAALDSASAELSRTTGVTAIGSRIVGEMIQPLSGIVINASTGLRMLAGSPPNVEGARETLRRTLRDCRRASEMITQLRVLLHSKETGAASYRAKPAELPSEI